eukprot:g2511.t1
MKETFKKVLSEVDIAISTAAIPGRPSPLLITKDAVAAMKAGSVVVDLAAIGGGNCELTRLNETYVTENGVTIIGFANLPARMAEQARRRHRVTLHRVLQERKPGGHAATATAHTHQAQAGERAGAGQEECKPLPISSDLRHGLDLHGVLHGGTG